MTLTLYGVTSDGTSVPIEVTDDGKLVVDTSSFGDYVKQGDDVEFGTITTDKTAAFGGATLDNDEVVKISRSTKGSPSNSIRLCVDDTEALKIAGGDNSSAVTFDYSGSASFGGHIEVGPFDVSNNKDGVQINPGGSINVQRNTGYAATSNLFAGYYGESITSLIRVNGSARFNSDVVIGSKGQQWLIRESNGVAMLIEETRRAPRDFEKVRDLPNELDLVEAALNEVMSRLKMVPPAGWPVWDGQSEVTTDNDIA